MGSKMQHPFRIFQRRGTNQLQLRTTELLDRLFKAPWFTSVGQPLPAHVHPVSSWSEAVQFASDPDEVFHEMRGEYVLQLRRVSVKYHERWNAVLTLVKDAIGDEIETRVETLAAVLDPPSCKKTRDQVTWAVLHACMESEYLDFVPAGPFLPMMEWFVAGRFPCGWFGKYPQGMLAVY
jgi:hypothetical protein